MRTRSSGFTAPAILMLAGIAWRVAWLTRQPPLQNHGAEALNATIAFARTGRFADALGPGEGLTAHLSPVMPVLGGLVYRALGVEAPLANWLLSLVALGLSMGAAAFLYLAFRATGAPRGGRLLGLGLYCLLPVSPYTELVEYRHWEGGLAIFLAAGLLWLVVASDAGPAASWPRRLAVALVAALLFFVNPPLGLAGYAMAAVLLWRRLEAGDAAATVGAAACIFAAVLAPWSVRNYHAFGRFVPVRGNAGIELALANHPAAVAGRDQQAVFLARLRAIHPNGNPPVFARMQAMGGEVPYAAMLGRQTQGWIRGHPLQFARLCIRHLVQFYFPPAWLWSVYGSFGLGTAIKQALIWACSLLALIGAAAAIATRRERFVYPVLLLLCPALPYLVVQPVLRYHQLVLALSMFMAADLAARIVSQRVRGPARERLQVG